MLESTSATVRANQPEILSLLPDLRLLWNESLGDPEIVIAVLDGLWTLPILVSREPI